MKTPKPIRVYLQYPWKFPDSPYYKSLVDNPPEGIEYLNIEKQKGVIINKKKFLFSNKLKRIIRDVFSSLKISIPNSHLSPRGDYDLIHCAHCLSKNLNESWVADFESKWQIYVGDKTEKAKKKVRKILQRENCKKILAWTEETKKEIVNNFPEIKSKIEVVYPAIPIKKIIKKNEGKINLIFSGRYFYWKGGLHALETIDRLTKKYKNVYGIVNSEIPEEIKKNYLSNKKIKFYELIPQEKLFGLYHESDIMVYPGYSDTFGFGFLEAMSFGIPVITVDGFARKELIEEGKTGFVIEKNFELNEKTIKEIEEKIIIKIEEKTSILIENKKLRDKMSQKCIQEIESGKFSIKERNKKLKRIYEEMLK